MNESNKGMSKERDPGQSPGEPQNEDENLRKDEPVEILARL